MHDTRNAAKRMVTASAPLHWPILLCSLPLFILSFLLPIHAKQLGASATSIGGMYSVIALIMVLMRPPVGWAMDRLGRKGFLVAGFVCYAGAMGLFAIAQDVTMLYLARLVQGFGRALTWIAAYTIAIECTTPQQRGEALGRVDGDANRGALYGALIALVLFSLITLHDAWRALFLGYAILAAVGAWLAWQHVPETRSASLASSMPEVVVSWPLLKLMVVVFVTSGSAALTSPLLLIFLQDRFTTDLAVLALAFAPAGLILGFLPAHLGRLSDHIGRVPLMVVGLVGSGVASLLLPRVPTLGCLVVVAIIKALSIVVVAPAQKALLSDLTGGAQRGAGYGFYSFAGSLGAVVGPPLGGWLYDVLGPIQLFGVNGLLLLASAAWVMLLLRNPKGSCILREGKVLQSPCM
ncbi:MAG TPA: MFS transporter [Candidatus Tectomicrobia bacterium]